MFSMMGPSAGNAPPDRPRLHIIGPLGLKALLRSTLSVCYASFNSNFVVHELLFPAQPEYPHHVPQGMSSFSYTETDIHLPEHVRGEHRTLPLMPPHPNELMGSNMRLDEASGTWPNVLALTGVTISAAPIAHRCPAVGYVFHESPSASQSISPRELAILDSNNEALFKEYGIKNPRMLLRQLLQERKPLLLPCGNELKPPPLDRPGRKLCILGDTSDATSGLVNRGMSALAQDADLLVHECTYASMNADDLDVARKVSEEHANMLQAALLRPEDCEERAVSRGHSTPRIVGTFAGQIGARCVVISHFSARIPAPFVSSTEPLRNMNQIKPGAAYDVSLRQFHVMREMERQVTEHWHNSISPEARTNAYERAIAAYDGLTVNVPARAPETKNM